MAKKYGGDDVFDALLVNANVGGENVHRGAVLGALKSVGGADAKDATRAVDAISTSTRATEA